MAIHSVRTLANPNSMESATDVAFMATCALIAELTHQTSRKEGRRLAVDEAVDEVVVEDDEVAHVVDADHEIWEPEEENPAMVDVLLLQKPVAGIADNSVISSVTVRKRRTRNASIVMRTEPRTRS